MDDVREIVKRAYGDLARQQPSCCGPAPSCCGGPYSVADHPVPEAELGVSCGNPVALSHLKSGDVVLDLGSGAGKDVFLAAQAVAPAGKAIGVDMTPEMLDLARRNAAKFRQRTGLANVEFRQGRIEQLPIEDAAIDVVISNCVINLSTDKPRVFREVYRVLKPGGRMIVSDIVLERPLPEEVRNDAGFYVACIAGALLRTEYLRAVRDAGFARVEVLDDRVYASSQCCDDPVTSGVAAALDGAAASVTILAVKDAPIGDQPAG